VVVLIVVGFLCFLSAVPVRAEETGEAAPTNPAFLEYMAQQEAAGLTGAAPATVSHGAHATGFIPSPIDFSYLRERASLGATAAAEYPAAFDLRTKNRVSPVKNQSKCGSCWAFAAVASLESNQMPAYQMDFSEQFIIDTHGFDYGPCKGGNEHMAMADVTRHGVFAEHLYPYEYVQPLSSLPATSSSAWPSAHISSVQLITTGLDSKSEPVTKNVKHALTSDLTAVAVCFNVIDDEPYLHEAKNGDWCFYNNTTDQGDGHCVAIVGWDDDYDKSNFGIEPPGNGAYIIKNSWGKSWGNEGYFYMSYYDKSLNTDAYVFNSVEPASTYNWTYQYDTLGWTNTYGWHSTTGSMANIFKAGPLGKVIRAVSFYTANPGTEYTVSIYDKCPTKKVGGQPVVDPVGGKLLYQRSGTFASAGYNTHVLAEPVAVSLGTSPAVNFSVVVRLTDTTGYEYPIPIQQQKPNYTDRSTVYTGQSYGSKTGASGSWEDFAAYDPDTKVYSGKRACLKAFGTAQ
jgi:C1A family cysteine protease